LAAVVEMPPKGLRREGDIVIGLVSSGYKRKMCSTIHERSDRNKEVVLP
jgi:hypothetical protein